MAPKFRPAIASQSFGRTPHHRTEEKLALCAEYGFEAIELFFEDLELVAATMQSAASSTTTDQPTPSTHNHYLLAAAAYIHNLCTHHNITILCLQPFANYEGLTSPTAHAARIQELHLWIQLAQALHTDLIQIPSSYLTANETTSSLPAIVASLREACDIGLTHTPPIRFAHEALAWATHHDHWLQVWEVVELVDRPNFGTCIDTFNLLGREYAEPTSPSGLTPNAEPQLRTTLHNLRTRLDPKKIFYIEAVDGERLAEPLVEGHEFYHPEQPARMSWSRNARLFPLEEQGYLPILEVLRAVEEVGYEGYVSFEFFSRTAHETGKGVPREHAVRAHRSWGRLCRAMGWEYDEVKFGGGSVQVVVDRKGEVEKEMETKVETATAAAQTVVQGSSTPVAVSQSPDSVPPAMPRSAHQQRWTATVLEAH